MESNNNTLEEVKEKHTSEILDTVCDEPDLDFIYNDTDTFDNEISELYSYTEQSDFKLNLNAFVDKMKDYHSPSCWHQFTSDEKQSVVMKLLNELDISYKFVRMKAARCLLYITQGCWWEVKSLTEYRECVKNNVMLLYQLGTFSAFVELLNVEANMTIVNGSISMTNSQDLRIILSVLYTITEVLRQEVHSSQYKSFYSEMTSSTGSDLILKLLNMVDCFYCENAPHFPIKKVLLLLWKLVLVSLGGTNVLKEMKNERRQKFDLNPLDEDTMDIAKTMKAFSPDLNKMEPLNKNQSNNLFDSSFAFDELPSSNESNVNIVRSKKCIPFFWKPKVYEKDIEIYLDNIKRKYLGSINLPITPDSVMKLPYPIIESVRILYKNKYTSLAEVQLQKERIIKNNRKQSEDVDSNPTEMLYRTVFPKLSNYTNALLRILLATMPEYKDKIVLNMAAEILPEEVPKTETDLKNLSVDIMRHKEIIVKAITAVLILLLKHFKLNHICQFETMSQFLLLYNDPLILRFFYQDMKSYVTSSNTLPSLDFPMCFINDNVESNDNATSYKTLPYSWRNMFSCINLLRILNKITKWKPARVYKMFKLKSIPSLMALLQIKHPVLQLYVLKLIKMQTSYLGRAWRRNNMLIISEIYTKVRHCFLNNWAIGEDIEEDCMLEECRLEQLMNRFNERRYGRNDEVKIQDKNCLTSVLSEEIRLSKLFKENYELWLEKEVFNLNTDWDKLMDTKI